MINFPNIQDLVSQETQWHVYPITDDLESMAVQEQANLRRENFGNKTRFYTNNNDIIGVLAREGVRKWCESQRMPFSISDYVPMQRGDTGDATIDGVLFDIKGIEHTKDLIPRLPFVRAKVWENQFEKLQAEDCAIDGFIFAVVARHMLDRETGTPAPSIFVLGWCPRNYFFNSALLLPKGYRIKDYITKAGRAEVEAHRLFPMGNLNGQNFQHIKENYE